MPVSPLSPIAAAAALAILSLAPLPAAAKGPVEVIMPEDPRAREMHERYGYAQAVVHGDTVYLSGVVAGRFGEESEEAAYDRAFRQIDAILRRAGSSLEEVLDMTTYHTELTEQIDRFAEVKRRHMPTRIPAWTAIDVDRLLPDGGMVEIKVVARRVGERSGGGL